MKKIFTLLAAAVMAISANADILYSWESTDSVVTEKGGKAVAMVDDVRVNYPNAVESKGLKFYTICLCGKGSTYPESAYVLITLDQPLATDDEITVTAYRNKDKLDAASNIYFIFDNDVVLKDENTWPNINPDGENDDAVGTNTFKVPAEANGSNTVTMTRNSVGTNLFITKVVISRGGTGETEAGEAGIADVTVAEDNNAPVYNLQGVQVDDSYKGIVIKNGKKYLNK